MVGWGKVLSTGLLRARLERERHASATGRNACCTVGFAFVIVWNVRVSRTAHELPFS